MARKMLTGHHIITSLALLLAALRLYFGLGGAGVFGTVTMNDIMALIDNPVSDGLTVIVVPFLILGVTGAVAALGMFRHKEWATYLTIAVCASTIAYDAWAVLEIQSSAMMGMVIPIVLLIYIKANMQRTRMAKEATA